MSTSDAAPALTIRAALPADAHELARLARELGYPNEVATLGERLRELCAQPQHWVAVASLQAGWLAGWAHVARCVSLEAGAYAEILGLVVDARARRAGVGRSLVVAAETWAVRQGLSSLTVRSNAARVESHLFYAALGYERPKSQHVYVKRLGRQEHV